MSENDTDDVPKAVRRKRSPRHEVRQNPGPAFDFDYAPFTLQAVESLLNAVNMPLKENVTRDHVVDRLNALGRRHSFWLECDRQPTSRQLISELKKLAEAAQKLAARLPLLPKHDGDDPPDIAPQASHGISWPLRDHLQKAMDNRIGHLRRVTSRQVLTMDKLERTEKFITVENEGVSLEGVFGASTAKDLLDVLSNGSSALSLACAAAIEHLQNDLSGPSAKRPTASGALAKTVSDLFHLYEELFGRKASVWRSSTSSDLSGPTLRFIHRVLDVLGDETSDENIDRIWGDHRARD